MKKVHELNREELVKVFENNSKLQEKVFDDMFENADFWNGEYLDCWKRGAVDYSIGYDRGTYFKATNYYLFIEGLKDSQKMYGFLADKYNSKIEYVEKLINRFDELQFTEISDLNYTRLETRIDELIRELENACYKRFLEEYEYCFDRENQLNHFVEFYAAERMDNNFYINEEYELFEHVEFIRNYA